MTGSSINYAYSFVYRSTRDFKFDWLIVYRMEAKASRQSVFAVVQLSEEEEEKKNKRACKIELLIRFDLINYAHHIIYIF